MRIHKFSFAAAIIIASMWLSGVPTYATVVFTTGNVPQPDEENVLFGTTQTGTTVTGATNISHTTVDFSSTTDTLMVTSVGQAKVTSTDGLVDDITISSPGHTFDDLIINPFKGSGTAEVTAIADGSTFTFSYVLGTGNNFLTIHTAGGETISSVTIDSSAGFQDLRQPRISGLAAVAVPEASAVTLTSLVLLAFGALVFRARRREQA